MLADLGGEQISREDAPLRSVVDAGGGRIQADGKPGEGIVAVEAGRDGARRRRATSSRTFLVELGKLDGEVVKARRAAAPQCPACAAWRDATTPPAELSSGKEFQGDDLVEKAGTILLRPTYQLWICAAR